MSMVANSNAGTDIEELEYRRDHDRPLPHTLISPPPPDGTPPPPLTPLTPLPDNVQSDPMNGIPDDIPIGIYGWRKRCLYFLVLSLVVVILVNLGLTVWILVVMEFSVHGMGNLRITDSGIRLEGRAEFVGPLYAQTISADQDSSLLVQSQDNINMAVADGNTQLTMNNNTLNITTPSLQVHPQDPSTLQSPALSITNDQILIGASQLNVTGSLGLTLEGPMETARLSSQPNEDLEIESPSGYLRLVGSRGVRIEDGPEFDGVQVSSSEDLSISSQNGVVVLDSPDVVMSGVRRTGDGEPVYEVCVCASGTLYLVPVTSSCQDNQGICSAP